MLPTIFLTSFFKELATRQALRLLPPNERWVEGTISSVCNTGSDWHVTISVTHVGTETLQDQKLMYIWWGGLNLPEPKPGEHVRVYLGKPLKEFPSGLVYRGERLYYRSEADYTQNRKRQYEKYHTLYMPPRVDVHEVA